MNVGIRLPAVRSTAIEGRPIPASDPETDLGATASTE
jgi:hypothetical protein